MSFDDDYEESDEAGSVITMPLTGTCNSCRGTFVLSMASRHVCQTEYQSAGRCEDYPCCGHRLGECADRAEYTSEFWTEAMYSMDSDTYERFCEIMDMQENYY